MSRERPILFSGPMVRALLEGRKTQTRRAVKHVADRQMHHITQQNGKTWLTEHHRDPLGLLTNSVYGWPGDRLWVKERHTLIADEFALLPGVAYAADGAVRMDVPMRQGSTVYNRAKPEAWKSRPSIHMRREHSRLTLEITEVRVQRVQEITRADAVAEGAESLEYLDREEWAQSVAPPGAVMPSPRGEFENLWNDLNYTRGYGWDANPWVWALTFKVIP